MSNAYSSLLSGLSLLAGFNDWYGAIKFPPKREPKKEPKQPPMRYERVVRPAVKPRVKPKPAPCDCGWLIASSGVYFEEPFNRDEFRGVSVSDIEPVWTYGKGERMETYA